MTTLGRRVACALIALSLVLAGTVSARADDALEARQLVERARLALQQFATDPVLDRFRELVKQARAVFIGPSMLRAAFILGASGGSGVLLAQDQGAWSGPAFYTLGGASIGLQIGGEASDVVLLIMSNGGLGAFQTSTFKLGADASVAAGPVGVGMAGSMAALNADIVQYSRSKGLYGGMSIDGSIVAVREGLNHAYYDKPVTPTDILIRRSVKNAEATPLIELLTSLSAK